MTDLSDISILSDLKPAERRRVLEALRAEPDAVRLAEQWRGLEAALAARWNSRFPDAAEIVDAAVPPSDNSQRREAIVGRGAAAGVTCLPDMFAAIESDAALFSRLWDKERLSSNRVSHRYARFGPGRFAFAAIVAIIVAAVGIGYGLTRGPVAPMNIAEGPDTGIAMIRLDDQSVVRLRSDSRIEYRIDDGARFVRLEGSALFDVTQTGVPFVVESENARIEVLGTTFAVRSDNSITETVVASGSVVVQAVDGRGGVRLGEGERSVVVGNSMPSEPAAVDIADALAWTGLIVFRSAPLSRIAESLQTIYSTEVTVSASLSGVVVTGTFDSDQTLSQILSIIAEVVDAAVEGDVDAGFRLIPR